ncbi:acyl-CoA thioester hydrolase [Lutibacter oricola]|uniref:Acyl-CoA thioester hydrolase n=1 Tax=Lutibacter oricola TaxID=762486 RepID=A0A1H2U4X7_9FLAO|nr:acyl-CoA thioesterase [Lutibacter oricola]SDW51272.1 acyl-CoA thioester hydrolase [Lutibacter oricola]
MKFEVNFNTKWSDFDPNRHMRHTAYNDYAAEVRVRFFQEHGLSINEFAKLNIGPILFKEETSFLKEIHIGENINVQMELEGVSKGIERWRFNHQIFNKDGVLAAEIKVYGAWIDLYKRKLTTPPVEFVKIFADLPKTENFKEIPLKSAK